LLPGLAVCLILFFSSAAGALPVTSGLVAHWPADGNAQDASGNGHDGSLEGDAGFAPGIVGQAFDLDGVGDRVTVPDDPAWTFPGDFSISLWVNLAALPPSTVGNPDSVFIGHDEGGGSQEKWFFALGGGFLSLHLNVPGTGSAFLAQTAFAPALGTWHHLAMIRSGSSYTIFVDGSAGPSESSSLTLPDAAASLTLGEAEGFAMEGLLDEVALYDRALSQTEIDALSVPEPAAPWLAAVGLAALLRRGRR
jgi:hypothetical protein